VILFNPPPLGITRSFNTGPPPCWRLRLPPSSWWPRLLQSAAAAPPPCRRKRLPPPIDICSPANGVPVSATFTPRSRRRHLWCWASVGLDTVNTHAASCQPSARLRPPAGHQPIIFVVSAPPPAPSPLTPRSLFSFLSPSIPWPCSDSPLTNRFACCLRRRHVASSIADLLMFPDDVTMDHMLPCHGSAHHPSLEDRLRGVGFGAW
jgi:hypothetical protein